MSYPPASRVLASDRNIRECSFFPVVHSVVRPPLVHGSFYVVAKIRITISAPPLNLAFLKQLPSTAGEVNPPFVATLRSAARTSPLGDCLSDWADALGVLLHVPRRMGADKSFTGRLLRTTALAGFRNVHRKFLSAFAKRVQFNE